MDDPWGSPWATNDSNHSLELPPRASTTLELPGRIITRNRSSSSISPWAGDEDVYHDWSAVDSGLALPPAAATPSSNAWSAWGGENGANSSQTHLSLRARENSLGIPSPAWPPTASPGLHQAKSPVWPPTASPGLYSTKTVSRQSSSRSLSRQLTPDPWATEASVNRLSLPAAVHIAAEQAAFSTMDRHDEEEGQEFAPTQRDKASTSVGLGIEKTETFEAGFERPPDTTPEVRIGTDIRDEAESLGHSEPEQNEQDHSGSPSLSRHSSLSNDSRPEERPESPITSMDEDTKEQRPTLRRASTKVQNMVELFDGLAKRKDSSTMLVPDPEGARRQSSLRSVSSFRSIRTDGASDFGEFEDAEEFDSAVPSRQPSASESRPNSKAGRPRSGSRASLRNPSILFAGVAAPSTILEEPSRLADIRARFGSVQFTTDKDLVDKLFDVAKLDKEQPAAKDYSLDAVEGIINDSFTSISERKTWYRISRPGTLRRHDLGDDDNYRRVTWAGSQVKEDATQIVRRWMEEDNYHAGRLKAGGGPMVRGGGFDWDSNRSKAETLSFDDIFGKRKSVQTPKLSTAPFSPPPSTETSAHTRSSSDGVKSLRSPLSIPAPPVGLAFGWSTGGSGASTPVSVRHPSLVRQSLELSSVKSGTSRPSSIREPEGRSSLQLAAPSTNPPSEVSKTNDLTLASQNEENDDNDDDDDEWGEMVASPTTDSRPASGFFEGSLNGSMTSLSGASMALPPAMPDTKTTLNSVSSALEDAPRATKALSQSLLAPTAAPVDVWDFSAFDSTPAAFSIPPTTYNPEFDFDTPLQSPTLSMPSQAVSPASVPNSKPTTPTVLSRTGSLSSIHSLKPSTPTVLSRSSSPVTDFTRAPTPPVAFRPQHSAKLSLSLVRPSPLHHVLTPEVALQDPVVPINPPPKTASFAEDDEPVDDAAVRRVVDKLPSLSYMLL